MRRLSLQRTFLCGVLASGFLMAGATNELDALKAGYAAEKARIDAAYEQQKACALPAYRQAIDAQMAVVKKKGDLDNYIALETEKKRLAAEGKVATNDAPEAVAALVAQYQKSLLDATSAREKAKMALLKQYVAKLTALMQTYTRSDRLDDAKVVRDELQLAKTDLVFQEEDVPQEAPKPPPPAAKPPPVADDPAKSIPGTWTITWRNMGKSGTDTVILSEDGTATCPKDRSVGKWEVKSQQCIIHWAATDNTLSITADPKRMMGHNRQGSSLTAVKTGL